MARVVGQAINPARMNYVQVLLSVRVVVDDDEQTGDDEECNHQLLWEEHHPEHCHFHAA